MPSGRCPRRAIAASRLRAVVVLPTPPFWLNTAMTVMRRDTRACDAIIRVTAARRIPGAPLRRRRNVAGADAVSLTTSRRARRGRISVPDSAIRVASLPLQIVVMAAGQGKRMHSARPKALHPLAGRPLVAHVLDAARALAPRALVLVVGHGGDAVRAALAAPDLAFVTQDPPRGTGDAVRLALAALPDDGVTLVANGDCPLIPAATFAALAEVAAAGKVAVLTARVSDPSGPRARRARRRRAVRAIVEERDATPARARDRRDLHRHARGADAAPAPLRRRAQRRQRAARVLPDRRRRAGGRRRRAGRGARRRRRGRRARRQRPRAARGDRAHRAGAARRRADEGRHLARRSGAHRHPRHAPLRARRDDRRRLRVRRRGRRSPTT